MFPRSQSGDPSRHGTFDDVIGRLPYVRAWASTSCTSRRSTRSGGPTARPQQHADPAPTTRAAPTRSAARKAATTPCTPSSARSRTSIGWSRRRMPTASRSRSTSRSNARITLDQGAPGVVRLAPRRHHQVRREPAQVRGHRGRPLLSRRAAVDLVRAARRRAVLDRPRREDLPGRQPAHQAGAVLGMADPRGAGSPPRGDLPPRRSPGPR